MSRDSEEGKQASNARSSDKWWLPPVKVPPGGLSEPARKMLYFQKDSVTQVQKAAMAINAQVLSEMAIPESYIDSLPKVNQSLIEYFISPFVVSFDFLCVDRTGDQALGIRSTRA